MTDHPSVALALQAAKTAKARADLAWLTFERRRNKRNRTSWNRADAVYRLALDTLRAAEASVSYETIHLADGLAQQALIPGVQPVSLTLREIAALAALRAARRGDAPLPSGGLFDETARAQQELF